LKFESSALSQDRFYETKDIITWHFMIEENGLPFYYEMPTKYVVGFMEMPW